MRIVRFRRSGSERVEVGVELPGRLVAVDVPDVETLLSAPLAVMRETVAAASRPVSDPVELLAPIDGRTEVWASGVTYDRSRAGRAEESTEATIYDRVYVADRPELFFKSVAWRVVGDGAAIGIRTDAAVTVPEAELALVLNRDGEIAGYTICDDVTSRSLEGENPLYLPQAKIFAGSCALGPGIVPVWTVEPPRDWAIAVTVRRGGAVVWSDRTSTARIRRGLDELASALTAPLEFPSGVVLSTGTGLVPGLDVSLDDGDIVDISIDHLGTLTNRVVRDCRR